MSSQAHADRLSQALDATGIFETVRASFQPEQIIVLGRVQKEKKGRWIDLLERLELASDTVSGLPQAWRSHLCQRYFLKEFQEGETVKKRIVFAWNISIQSSNMDASIETILKVLRGEIVSVALPGEVEEMPMTGVDHERNVPNEKGRGAYHIASQNGAKDFRPITR